MIPTNHEYRSPNIEAQRRIAALLPGQKMQDLPVELWHASFKRYVLDTPYRGGGPNLRLIRLRNDEPSLTVTGFIFNKFVHPTENRYVTVREAARLQGFPDWVGFHGGIGSTRQQVGNAVPPALASAVLGSLSAALGLTIKNPGEALSLFSGAGGFDLGALDVPGLIVRAASDSWKDAVLTLRGWSTDIRVDHLDIREMGDPAAYWRRVGACAERPSIVFGGPPCQSFSQAGKQRGEVDARGALVFEFLRVVDALKPDAFVLENVANIRGIAKGALLRRMIEVARASGYDVSWRVLHAPEFGVPQRRKRFFMIGIAGGRTAADCWPVASHGGDVGATKPIMTVAEAFRELPPAHLAGPGTRSRPVVSDRQANR